MIQPPQCHNEQEIEALSARVHGVLESDYATMRRNTRITLPSVVKIITYYYRALETPAATRITQTYRGGGLSEIVPLVAAQTAEPTPDVADVLELAIDYGCEPASTKSQQQIKTTPRTKPSNGVAYAAGFVLLITIIVGIRRLS